MNGKMILSGFILSAAFITAAPPAHAQSWNEHQVSRAIRHENREIRRDRRELRADRRALRRDIRNEACPRELSRDARELRRDRRELRRDIQERRQLRQIR